MTALLLLILWRRKHVQRCLDLLSVEILSIQLFLLLNCQHLDSLLPTLSQTLPRLHLVLCHKDPLLPLELLILGLADLVFLFIQLSKPQ